MAVNVNGPDKIITSHFTMIVCGQTGAGKTQFIYQLIQNLPQVMSDEEPFSKIIYAFGIYQPFYKKIAELPNVQLHEGVPEVTDTVEKKLLILDDLFLDTNKSVASIFTKQRHLNMSTIFVVHNFFHECKYMRTITRNANYLVLFKNPRDMCQISYLGRQMYPNHKLFLTDAFAKATEAPYSYLFVDLKPTTPEELRVKSKIFPGQDTEYYLKYP